jgi:hypothetical protein
MARLIRRLAGTLALVVICTTTALAPAHADTGRDPQQILRGRTGATGQDLRGPIRVAGLTVSPATDAGRTLRTLVQHRTDRVTIAAVLRPGQHAARFALDLPAGQRLEPAADGGLAVVSGHRVVGLIDAPWAVDARGRALATRYQVHGTTIVQDVDTRGASFPVVADPTIRTGFHIVPVFYVQYTWTETWWVKNHLPEGAISWALLCSRTGEAAPFCAFYGGIFGSRISSATNAAIAHHRCLKMRVPATMGAVGLPAFAAYYVTCTS